MPAYFFFYFRRGIGTTGDWWYWWVQWWSTTTTKRALLWKHRWLLQIDFVDVDEVPNQESQSYRFIMINENELMKEDEQQHDVRPLVGCCRTFQSVSPDSPDQQRYLSPFHLRITISLLYNLLFTIVHRIKHFQNGDDWVSWDSCHRCLPPCPNHEELLVAIIISYCANSSATICQSILYCVIVTIYIQGETQARILQTCGFRRANHCLARRRGLRQIRDSSLKEGSASVVSVVEGQSLPAETMRKSPGILQVEGDMICQQENIEYNWQQQSPNLLIVVRILASCWIFNLVVPCVLECAKVVWHLQWPCCQSVWISWLGRSREWFAHREDKK